MERGGHSGLCPPGHLSPTGRDNICVRCVNRLWRRREAQDLSSCKFQNRPIQKDGFVSPRWKSSLKNATRFKSPLHPTKKCLKTGMFFKVRASRFARWSNAMWRWKCFLTAEAECCCENSFNVSANTCRDYTRGCGRMQGLVQPLWEHVHDDP